MSMKVFRLACARGHDFEGWFASAEEIDRQREAGLVRCPLCDERDVSRLPSAPYVNTGSRPPQPPPAASEGNRGGELGQALAKLKAYVLANTEDVGRQFPEVARRMHYGEESRRAIRGRVAAGEAQELREEGIEALALPPGLGLDDNVH